MPGMKILRCRTWKQYFASALLCFVVLTACTGNSTRGGGASAADTTSVAVSHELRLEVPVPPAMLSDSAKLEFVAEHYWDNFDYADTAWIADTTALERAFAGWAGLLERLPREQASALSGRLIVRAEATPAMLLRLSETAERFFDDPNSPYRSEDLYIPVLEAVLASQTIDTLYQVRLRAQLTSAMKNRPGMPAADFVYTRGDGTTGRLYGLTADYTLLLFYVPDCPNCAVAERYIAASESLAPLIASGRLKVLAVYPGKDPELWREHLPAMPADWTVGRDARRAIDNRELYDIRATPSLYLLDRDKRVILKDVRVERIERELRERHVPESTR